MKKSSVWYLLMISCIALFINIDRVYAAGEEDKLGYTVSLVEPKTQIDPDKSYFYVKTKPGEEQTLEVKIKSTKKEAVKINVSSANAFTGDGGTIEYTEDPSDQDVTLKEPVRSLLTVETPELTVGNFEEKRVRIKLTPPKEEYSGVKMGALVFALDQGKEDKNGVSTEFSYRIGVIISESGDEFNNAQSLNLNAVKASIERGKKMVLANLQNPESKVLENLTLNATMTKKGTDKVIKKKTVENYSLAPNSHFDFEIDWGVDSIPSGTYILKLDAHNEYQEWQLSKEFTITNQQAKKMNEESVFKIITPTWLKVVALGLCVSTVLNTSVIFLRRRKWEILWEKIRIAKRKEKKLKKRKPRREKAAQ